MKVTRNTPEQLIIEERPWFTGIGISALSLFFTGAGIFSVLDGEFGGMIFFVGTALGALAFWAFVRRLMVIFDRHGGQIEIRRKWVGGQSVETLDLKAVRKADVEFRETYRQGKMRRTSRPTLVMFADHDPQKLALVEHFSGGRSSQVVADEINEWLAQGAG
ncbi:hypothetical protein [Marimonas lutisalis]|uniref:hypothetical protein n=1 Tax=Marimonas lutisalis TaxID=2545756 RepID=UPI0010F9AEDF|nr:hypothetical protein [Marimonas lutisalis]